MRWSALFAVAVAGILGAQSAPPAGVLPWSRSAGDDDTVRLDWIHLGAPGIPDDHGDAPLFRATRTVLASGSYRLTIPSSRSEFGLRAIRDLTLQQSISFPLQREALEPAADYVNAYFGGDRTKWQEKLPVYGLMRIRDVLPGIDVDVSGSLLFHHYHVTAREPALLQPVVFDFGSDTSPHAQSPITAWQERDGARIEVRAAWRLPDQPGRTMLHVDAAAPDPALPLHLEFDWPRLRFDGDRQEESIDAGAVVAIDGDGSLFAASNARARRQRCIVVQKFSGEGKLLFTTYIGGANPVSGALAIEPDSRGGVWIAGSSSGPELPSDTADACTSGCKPFVARLAADGTLISAAVVELPEPHVVLLDAGGMLYAAGEGRIEHPASAEPPQHTLWVAKADASKRGAAAILYATQLRGGVYPRALAVDRDGTILVGGSALPDGLAFPKQVPGERKTGSAFLLRLDPRQRGVKAFVKARLLAGHVYGSHYNSVQAIAVDAGGDVVIAGQSAGGRFEPDLVHHGPRPYPLHPEHVFVYRLGPELDTVWAATIGGSEDDWAHAVAIDAQGHIWILGQTDSLDFPLRASPVHASATSRLFAARLDASGRTVHASVIAGAIEKNPDASSWRIAAAADGTLWLAAQSMMVLAPGGTIGVPERYGARLSLLRIGSCRNCPAVKSAPARKRPAKTAAATNDGPVKPKRAIWIPVAGGGAAVALLGLIAALALRNKKKRAARSSRPPNDRLRKR
jgi:hypothetical protein